ncbi:MAG: hypothetical protein AB8E15_05705 [Bdellovibrionales bacterium]
MKILLSFDVQVPNEFKKKRETRGSAIGEGLFLDLIERFNEKQIEIHLDYEDHPEFIEELKKTIRSFLSSPSKTKEWIVVSKNKYGINKNIFKESVSMRIWLSLGYLQKFFLSQSCLFFLGRYFLNLQIKKFVEREFKNNSKYVCISTRRPRSNLGLFEAGRAISATEIKANDLGVSIAHIPCFCSVNLIKKNSKNRINIVSNNTFENENRIKGYFHFSKGTPVWISKLNN